MPKIIYFHEIINPKWFEEIIKLLISKYTPCTMDDIRLFLQGGKINSKSFLLTIDDGCLTDYTVVYPVLKKYNLQAVILVSPHIVKTGENFWFQEIEGYDRNKIRDIIADKFNLNRADIQNFYPTSMLKNMRIDDILDIISTYQKRYSEPQKPRRNMNYTELEELKNSGYFTIGSHTQTHPILANESDDVSKKQITDSIIELSDILNSPVKLFAYTNGVEGVDYGTREMQYLKENSIEYAFSLTYKKFHAKNDPLNIPRLILSNESPSTIKKKFFVEEYLRSVKELLFNNETKHRKLIKNTISFY